MFDFIEYAKKAQEDLQAQQSKIDAKVADLEKGKAVLYQNNLDFEAKLQAQNARDIDLNQREEGISLREQQDNKKVDAQRLYDEAAMNVKIASELAAKAKENNDEATQKLAEVAKRELALSEREKTYKEEIKKEAVERVWGSMLK